MVDGDGPSMATPESLRATVDGLRGGGRGWLLALIAAGWLLIHGFRLVLPALLPDIKADFTIDNTAAGFALTVLWLLYATMQFPSGIAADRLGERPWIVIGMLLGALSLGAFFVAPVYGLFLAACVVFGIGAGLFGTPRDMLLTRTYPTADSTAYSVIVAAGSIGAAALPIIAAAIAVRFDWRIASIWPLPLFLLIGFGLWRIVPRATIPDPDRLQAGETIRQTLAALTGPRVLLGGSVMLLYIFTFQGLTSFLPTYLIEIKGLGAGRAATLFGLMFVVGAIVTPMAGHLADRFGERATLLGVIAVSTVLLVALTVVGGPLVLSILVPLLGVRIAVAPVTSAFIVRELPGSVKGTGWGFLRTMFFGLGATASTVIGLFADAGFFDAAFLLIAGLTGLAGVCWLLIPGRPVNGEWAV